MSAGDADARIARVAMERLRGGGSGGRTGGRDAVVVEEPMEIRIGKVSIAVTMRTPGHDDELAAGFLYTEGILDQDDAISRIAPCEAGVPESARGNVIVVELDEQVTVDLERIKRNFYATSSCGICGKASIDQVRQCTAPIESRMLLSLATVLAMPERMRDAQAVFGETGGLHAAALFSADGQLRCLREDVGRHNAVDKLVGWAVLNGELPLDDTVLLVSGRASFEIVQKALMARVPAVAAVSAPSSLAVALATDSGMTLIGFLRDDGMNVYCGGDRIQ